MSSEQIQEYPTKLLFVCSMNKQRSYTAEKLFATSHRYQVRSRGTDRGARIRVTESDIGWADMIFVMEKNHANLLRRKYRSALAGKRLVTLFVEDLYDAMDPALIEILSRKLSPYVDLRA